MRPAKYSREYRNSRRAFIGYEAKNFLFVDGGIPGQTGMRRAAAVFNPAEWRKPV
jgi:hypothetical protein